MEPFIASVAAVVLIVAAWHGQGSRGFYLAPVVLGGLTGSCAVQMTPSPEQWAAIVASGDEGEIMDAVLFRDQGIKRPQFALGSRPVG